MPGYPEFATLLARFPELMMMRKFDQLGVKMLLYQQAELLYLDKDLDIFASLDEGKEGLSDINQCWVKLNQAFADGECELQRQKMEAIRVKLKDYHETLLRMHQVQCLKGPSNLNHASVRDWLDRKDGGNRFLNHVEADPWLPPRRHDLVSLQGDQGNDGLDQWLARTIAPLYHCLWGHRTQPDVEATSNVGPIWEYRLQTYSSLGNLICIAMSCIVPLASILALYFANQPYLRLVLISIFTILFAVLIGTMATSRRADVFAATVAFAAVQVVFLQGVDHERSTR